MSLQPVSSSACMQKSLWSQQAAATNILAVSCNKPAKHYSQRVKLTPKRKNCLKANSKTTWPQFSAFQTNFWQVNVNLILGMMI